MMIEVFSPSKTLNGKFDAVATLAEAKQLLEPMGFVVDATYGPVPMSNSYIVRATATQEVADKAATHTNPRLMVWSDPQISSLTTPSEEQIARVKRLRENIARVENDACGGN